MPEAKRASDAVRFYVAVGLGVTAAVIGILLRRESVPPPPRPPQDDAIATWCADGFEAIRGGCLALPPRSATPGKPTPLVIFLHGRYGADGVERMMETQARVGRIGTARGYAVLALRGRQGECTDPTLASWWCWPSNERNAADGPAFVQRFMPPIAEAERRIGRGRRVLLGFSNGAYFAALIASRSLLPIDAVAIAHGGPVEPMTPVGAPPPALLVNADEDPSDAEMQRLAADLTRERWPFAFVERGGGHALPDWDVEMALTFFDRTAREPLPLVPPLSPPHVRSPSASASASPSPPSSPPD
ncbi:MAG: hypothetical protein JST00_22195 [Deltaproteobacteria bacterium]|nr:hypothetical protein [Deltaproteobacteria bacterium]